VNGYVLNVAWFTTVIPMPLSTFWPRGTRLLPVEGVQDLVEQRLVGQLPVKQETPIRESGEPLPQRQGADVTLLHKE
jgi:hypothetical protein